MREYKAIFICILICNVFCLSEILRAKQITHMKKRKVFQEHKRFVNDRYD